ncbi:MAG: TetR/AcrR family transcriptional regulator [Panacagrimonas sp.]
MRYSARHKETTRQRILDEAGQLAKEKGFGTTGVDTMMAAAGLTAGSFYAHFRSKSELLAALVDREMRRSLAMFDVDTDEALAAALASYLSVAHVEHPRRGCPLPALSAEIARADDLVREIFEQRLLQIHQAMRRRCGTADEAWSLIAQAVGAVTLARAVHTSKTGKQLVDSARRQITQTLTNSATRIPKLKAAARRN